MKELSIEAKAKAYDEAVEALCSLFAKQAIKHCDRVNIKDITNIFPELKESESEDERIRKAIKYGLDYVFTNNTTIYETTKEQCLFWLEKQGEQILANFAKTCKDEQWSEEDEKILNLIIARLHSHKNVEAEEYGKDYHWLKSLKGRYTWKPSEEMLEALCRAIPENTMAISEDEMLLNKLYQGLKYGRVLSNK